MAPELFNINAVSNEGNSGLSTRESDAFALGMVTFEVMDVPHGRFFHSLKCHLVPSGIHWTSAIPGVQGNSGGNEKDHRR